MQHHVNFALNNFALNMLSESRSSHVSYGSKLNFVNLPQNRLTSLLSFDFVSGHNKKVVKHVGYFLSNNLLHQHLQSDYKVRI